MDQAHGMAVASLTRARADPIIARESAQMLLDVSQIPWWLALGWTFLAGAAVGSFLNVVIARVPAGESIVHPRSRCPSCGAPIRWYDNLPIVSWLALRARCRACGSRISARYPLVEALGAAAAVVTVIRHGLSGAAAAEFAFSAALVALAFIDLDAWLLPNAITWPLIAFGLAMGPLGVTPAGSLRAAAYGAGLGFAAFAIVSWLGQKAFRKEALGFGDVWLLAGLGAWMGPAALLPVVLLASIQGSVVGIALIALGKGEPGPEEPSSAPDPVRRGTSPRPTEDEETAVPAQPPTSSAAPAGVPSQPRGCAPDRDERGQASPAGEPSQPHDPAPGHDEHGQGSTSTSESPIVDEPEADWVPPKNAVPFGPFLVAGALEWLWLGGLMAQAVPVLRLFR